MDCLDIDSVFDIYRWNGSSNTNWLCLRMLHTLFRLKSLVRKYSEIDWLRRDWIDVFQRRNLISLLILLRTSFKHFKDGGKQAVHWYLPCSSFFLCPTPKFRLLMRSFFLHPRKHLAAQLSVAVKPCSMLYSLSLLVLMKAHIQVQLIQRLWTAGQVPVPSSSV